MAKKAKGKAKPFKSYKASKTTALSTYQAGISSHSHLNAQQRLNASAQKRMGRLLQKAAKANAKAQKKATLAKSATIAANAVKQDLQLMSKGRGQHSQLIRAMQVRYTFFEQQAKRYLHAYSRQTQGGGYLQRAQVAEGKTETLAQAKAYIKRYNATHKLSAAAKKAYNAKQTKLQNEHVEHMEHLEGLEKKGAKLTAAQRSSVSTFRKQMAAGAKYQASKKASRAKKSAAKKAAKKKQKKARGATGACNKEFGSWLHGFNDEYDSCVPTAVCNRLRMLAVPLTNIHVFELMTCTGEKCCFEDCLENVRECAPYHLDFYPISVEEGRAVRFEGMLIGFNLPDGRPHAAVVANGEAIYWGDYHEIPANVDEAWFLGWSCG